MTDAEFVFVDDIRSKKATARSASRKNRSGKGPVRFPSDNLTKKELKKMSGEVVKYNLSKPIDFKNFKDWPFDIQQEYLDKIYDRFHPTWPDLEQVFGMSMNTIRKHVYKHKLKFITNKGNRSCKDNPEWQNFLNSASTNFSDTLKRIFNNVQTQPTSNRCPVYIDSGPITIVGYADDVINVLDYICGTNKYKFTVRFEEIEEE